MISVIIVGYNSKKYLKDCFDSLAKSSYKNYRVYFLDNNSSDNSVDFVKENYKKTKIITLHKNIGFAEGNNIAVRRAIDDGCDYVFLLNPDTVVDKNCMRSLVSRVDGQCILQPLLLLHDGKNKTNLINTSGNLLHYLGFSYVGDYKKNYEEAVLNTDITIASGAAMLIPVGIVKKIGLFDGDFFMYHEDVDFSWRARLCGYNIKLVPDSFVWHKYSFTRNVNKFYYAERNRLLFILKNFSVSYILLISLPLAFNELMMVIYSITGGWFLNKINSYIYIARHWPQLMYERKAIRRMIVRSDRDMFNYFTKTIDFIEMRNILFGAYNVMLQIPYYVLKLIYA